MKTEAERRRELERMDAEDLIHLSDLAKGGGSPGEFAGITGSEAKKSWINTIIAHEKSKGLISD